MNQITVRSEDLRVPSESSAGADSGATSSAIVLTADAVLGERIAKQLREEPKGLQARTVPLESNEAVAAIGEARPTLVVIAPGEARVEDRPRRLSAIANVVQACVDHGIQRLILISSGAIYAPDHHMIGFVLEGKHRRPSVVNTEADWWQAVEEEVRWKVDANSGLSVLVFRAPLVGGSGGNHFVDRIIRRGFLIRYAGFNPPLQVLSVSALAKAISEAFRRQLKGIYHVAPDNVVPLRSMLRCKGVRSIAVPRTLQRFLRPLLFRHLDGVETTDQLDYLRYPWTLSGEKFARETGLCFSSRAALAEIGAENATEPQPDSQVRLPEFDRFGSDPSFYKRQGRSTFRFAEEVYWRIESRGFEHLPRDGPAIIAGPHRGFMPLDAVMMFHLVYRYTGRAVRFLIHPTLVKFPFQGNFFQKMAGVMACKTNAERVLDDGDILGVYPEGIAGAFKLYREAYNLRVFGRADYARWALEYDVPVIPFVIVGSAEIFPIFGRLKWRWLKDWLEWPFFPITATFPFLPLPLPTKWHMQFLPPVHPTDVKAEAQRLEKDPVAVFAGKVRSAIDSATQDMLRRRRSIFFGNIWSVSDRGSTQ